MANRHALGKKLAILGLISFVIVAAVVESASQLSKRKTDAEIHARVQTDTFRLLETIRDRLLQRVRAAPGLPARAIANANDWLAPFLASTVIENETYVYAMVVSHSGTIVAHSDGTQINTQVPEHIREQITVARGRKRWASELDAWFGDDRIVNYALPVMVDGALVATAHIGVSVPALDQQKADERWEARRMFWLAATACMLVVATGCGIAWLMITRARRTDEAEARRNHLAEVGKLAGGLVHEIRNPLNAMRMQIAVMRGKLKRLPGEESEAAAHQLSRLESEVLRLQDLAASFLAYGRPPTDKLQELDAAEILGDVADFLQAEFEQRGLAIKLEIDPQVNGATMVMDRGKLRQVLLNLADNALHAMSEGGTLTLGVTREASGPLSFTVKDTGRGIPKDRLASVFDAFFSMKDDGNGLGLSIVKQIVESSGGTIRVQSEIGCGTCFTLCFPTTTKAQRRELRIVTPAQPSEVTA